MGERPAVAPANPSAPTAPASRIDAVVTHHKDSFRSGVGRFNELLAERLDVPVVGIRRLSAVDCRRPLLSFKAGELGAGEVEELRKLLETDRPWEIFLHAYEGLDLERALVERAARVHCGNHEVFAQVRALNPSCQTLWSPGLILDERLFTPRRDLGVLVRDGAQDPHRPLPAAARAPRRLRAELRAVRVGCEPRDDADARRAADLRRAARDLPDPILPREPLRRRASSTTCARRRSSPRSSSAACAPTTGRWRRRWRRGRS